VYINDIVYIILKFEPTLIKINVLSVVTSYRNYCYVYSHNSNIYRHTVFIRLKHP